MLAGRGVERILREGSSVGAGASGEDFGHVVQRLRIGIAGADGQLFEQVVGAKFHLCAIVVRVAAVIAIADNTLIAIDSPDRRGYNSLSRRARSKACRNKVRERSLQTSYIWISVDCLEQVGSPIAHVAGFDS